MWITVKQSDSSLYVWSQNPSLENSIKKVYLKTYKSLIRWGTDPNWIKDNKSELEALQPWQCGRDMLDSCAHEKLKNYLTN